tara:strand:- start:3877 stop:4578 length:702 start_codon:yes stop_codon:yes gene_type:complete
MFFINPPFGNYINLPDTKSIKGSFTLEAREGLIPQIIKTLRYSFKYNDWVNKIGLRNNGIKWALENYNNDHIISIAILNKNEIPEFLKIIPKNQDLEINISCPNAEKEMINNDIEKFLNKERKWCILKLSPKSKNDDIDYFYNKGFRQFHCCNTIPVPEGGLSGKSIIPYTNEKVNYIKSKYKDSTVIAGGGITEWNDVVNYRKKGADHFSVSTNFFNPIKSVSLYYQYIKNK